MVGPINLSNIIFFADNAGAVRRWISGLVRYFGDFLILLYWPPVFVWQMMSLLGSALGMPRWRCGFFG